jgi:hypothetical protein
VVAGEVGRDVTAQRSGEAMADAFMESGGDGDGEDGHADDCEFAIGFGRLPLE